MSRPRLQISSWFLLSTFLDPSLALNTLVAGSRDLWSSSWCLGRELPGPYLWLMLTSCSALGETEGRLCRMGQREWRPFLSTIPARSSLERLPSLDQETPLGTAGLKWVLVFLTWADWQYWVSNLVKRKLFICFLLPCLCKHSRAALC